MTLFEVSLFEISQIVNLRKRKNLARLNNGDNAVNLAASGGHLEFVKFLVETWGANYDEKNNEGKDALALASSRSHLDAIEYLLNEQQKR